MSWRGRFTFEVELMNGDTRVYNILETANRLYTMRETMPVEVYEHNADVLQRMRWDPALPHNLEMQNIRGGHHYVTMRDWFVFYGVYEVNFVDLTELETDSDEDDMEYADEDIEELLNETIGEF